MFNWLCESTNKKVQKSEEKKKNGEEKKKNEPSLPLWNDTKNPKFAEENWPLLTIPSSGRKKVELVLQENNLTNYEGPIIDESICYGPTLGFHYFFFENEDDLRKAVTLILRSDVQCVPVNDEEHVALNPGGLSGEGKLFKGLKEINDFLGEDFNIV